MLARRNIAWGLRAVLAILGAVALVIGLCAFPAEAAGPQWSLQPVVNPDSSYTILGSISCKSSDCMAVGQDSNVVLLAEYWNGKTWSVTSVPEPTNSEQADLTGVSCTAPTACTAVGWTLDSTIQEDVPFADRWNGKTWVTQPLPSPAGSYSVTPQAVSCSTTTSCIAVGQEDLYGGTTADYAATWNGKTWSLQSVPFPLGVTGSQLAGISCKSATNCVAVGSSTTSDNQCSECGPTVAQADFLNGSTWTVEPTPNPSGASDTNLLGVSCATTTACVAVGIYGTTTSAGGLAEFWNGSSWSLQQFATPPSALAALGDSVSCTTATACTAVGEAVDPSGNDSPLAESWNGKIWSAQSTPSPAGASGAELPGVSCVSATVCSAVGTEQLSGGGDISFAEHLAAAGGLL